MSAQAVDVYWNGAGSSWNDLSSWATAGETTTPNPAIMAGTTEMATFNTSALSTAQTVDLDAAQSVLGVSFTSPGTVLLQAGGENRVLALGAGGINKSGSGEVTIGSATGGEQVSLSLGADQSRTWTDIFKSADGTMSLLNWASVFSGGFQYSYNGQTLEPTSSGSFAVSGGSLTWWSALPESSNLLAGLLAVSALLRRRRVS